MTKVKLIGNHIIENYAHEDGIELEEDSIELN